MEEDVVYMSVLYVYKGLEHLQILVIGNLLVPGHQEKTVHMIILASISDKIS